MSSVTICDARREQLQVHQEPTTALIAPGVLSQTGWQENNRMNDDDDEDDKDDDDDAGRGRGRGRGGGGRGGGGGGHGGYGGRW